MLVFNRFIFFFNTFLFSHGVDKSDEETSTSDGSPSKKKRKRFLDAYKTSCSNSLETDLTEVSRYFNEANGGLENLERFPQIKKIFM